MAQQKEKGNLKKKKISPQKKREDALPKKVGKRNLSRKEPAICPGREGDPDGDEKEKSAKKMKN